MEMFSPRDFSFSEDENITNTTKNAYEESFLHIYYHGLTGSWLMYISL